jgi:transcriptional regulator with XRE-family HTH domain
MCRINGMTQMYGVADLAFDLTDRLHKSMRVSGMTTTTLGEALGVHRNTISNYLTGRSRMDRRTLISWAFATGVPLAWLEHGEEPSPGPDGGGGVVNKRYDVCAGQSLALVAA